MKLLAGLIITVSLVLGTIGAATAYNPKLEAIDPAGPPLTLNAAAGRDPADPTRPLLDPAASDAPIVLTPDRVEALRAAGVTRVRVKEFGWSRWDEWWLFALSCVGLAAGAVLFRIAARDALTAAQARERHPTETPDHALTAARDELRQLIEARSEAGDDRTRAAAIAHALDGIRRTHQVAIEDAQTELVSRLGLSGHAQFMDRFARAERQLHRAWSAAVDGAMEESEACLERAAAGLEESMHRLAAG
jgi:hypothetical protein